MYASNIAGAAGNLAGLAPQSGGLDPRLAGKLGMNMGDQAGVYLFLNEGGYSPVAGVAIPSGGSFLVNDGDPTVYTVQNNRPRGGPVKAIKTEESAAYPNTEAPYDRVGSHTVYRQMDPTLVEEMRYLDMMTPATRDPDIQDALLGDKNIMQPYQGPQGTYFTYQKSQPAQMLRGYD
jgi:hypothetical protein